MESLQDSEQTEVAEIAAFVSDIRARVILTAKERYENLESTNFKYNAPAFIISNSHRGTVALVQGMLPGASSSTAGMAMQSQFYARQALRQVLINTLDSDEQDVGKGAVMSALEAEAESLRREPWRFAIPPGAAVPGRGDEASRREREARDAARKKLVNMFGPALGYTPESAGISHVPRPLRMSRVAKVRTLRDRGGPAGYVVSTEALAASRSRMHGTAGRKVNLGFASAKTPSSAVAKGRPSLLSPVTPPVPNVNAGGNSLAIAGATTTVLTPASESKDGGETVSDASSVSSRDHRLDDDDGGSSQESDGDGDGGYGSEGSAPGRLQAGSQPGPGTEVDDWAGVTIVRNARESERGECGARDREGKEQEGDERGGRKPGGSCTESRSGLQQNSAPIDAFPLKVLSRRTRASSAPAAAHRAHLHLGGPAAHKPPMSMPFALRVWAQQEANRLRRLARARFSADLAHAHAQLSCAPGAYRTRSKSASPAGCAKGTDEPALYPADAVRRIRPLVATIAPVRFALLSDLQWFKLCLVRARERRMRRGRDTDGPGVGQLDIVPGLELGEKASFRGVPFGKISGVSVALARARERQRVRDVSKRMRRTEQEEAEARKLAASALSSGRQQAPLHVQDTASVKEHRGRGRGGVVFPNSTRAAAAKEDGAPVQAQAVWYATQLHESFAPPRGPSAERMSTHARLVLVHGQAAAALGEELYIPSSIALRSELSLDKLPAPTEHAGKRRLVTPMAPLAKTSGRHDSRTRVHASPEVHSSLPPCASDPAIPGIYWSRAPGREEAWHGGLLRHLGRPPLSRQEERALGTDLGIGFDPMERVQPHGSQAGAGEQVGARARSQPMKALPQPFLGRPARPTSDRSAGMPPFSTGPTGREEAAGSRGVDPVDPPPAPVAAVRTPSASAPTPALPQRAINTGMDSDMEASLARIVHGVESKRVRVLQSGLRPLVQGGGSAVGLSGGALESPRVEHVPRLTRPVPHVHGAASFPPATMGDPSDALARTVHSPNESSLPRVGSRAGGAGVSTSSERGPPRAPPKYSPAAAHKRRQSGVKAAAAPVQAQAAVDSGVDSVGAPRHRVGLQRWRKVLGTYQQTVGPGLRSSPPRAPEGCTPLREAQGPCLPPMPALTPVATQSAGRQERALEPPSMMDRARAMGLHRVPSPTKR